MRTLVTLVLVLLSCDLPSGMPTVINPAAPPIYPASITGPADGDLANAASVNAAFQALMTATEAARRSTWRGHSHGVRYTSTNGTDITVSAVGSVLVTAGGTWRSLVNVTQSTWSAAAKLGAALGQSTRYYFYLYDSGGGVLDWLVTTDVPDNLLMWRNGATDYGYVGTFITDSAGVVIPFWNSEGGYRYAMPLPAATATDLRVLNAAAGAAWTSMGVGHRVPSWATETSLVVSINAGAGGTQANLRGGAVTAANWGGRERSVYEINAGNGPYHEITVSGAAPEYDVGSATSVTAYVVGWR